MPARISCVCIDAVDPRPVADFWAAVLEWEVVEDHDEGISLASPGRDLPMLDILRVPEGNVLEPRVRRRSYSSPQRPPHMGLARCHHAQRRDRLPYQVLFGCHLNHPSGWGERRCQASAAPTVKDLL
jgi:hypothetical protein